MSAKKNAKKSVKNEEIRLVVQGEAIAELARTLWQDDREPEKALRVLNAAFPDVPESKLIALCLGEQTLEGDSSKGMQFVEYHGDQRKSMGDTLERHRSEVSSLRDQLALSQGGAATCIISDQGRATLVPRWRCEGHPPQLLEGLKLSDVLNKPATAEDRRALYEAQQEPEEPRVPEEPRAPLSSPVITGDTGWLAIDGRFYQCAYREHATLAVGLGWDEQDLERANWIKLQHGTLLNYDQRGLSQPQLDALFDWCTENGWKLQDVLERGGAPSSSR